MPLTSETSALRKVAVQGPGNTAGSETPRDKSPATEYSNSRESDYFAELTSRIPRLTPDTPVEIDNDHRQEMQKRLNALDSDSSRYIKDCCRNLESLLDLSGKVFKALRNANDKHRQALIVDEAKALLLNHVQCLRYDLSLHPLVAHHMDHADLMSIRVGLQKAGYDFHDEDWCMNINTLADSLYKLEDYLTDFDTANFRPDVFENLVTRAETNLYVNMISYNIDSETGLSAVSKDRQLFYVPFDYLKSTLGLEKIVFDMDDCMFMSEDVQQRSWGEALGRARSEGRISEEAYFEGVQFIDYCFQTKDMKNLGQGLYDKVVELSKESDGFNVRGDFPTCQDFDNYFISLRVEVLKDAARRGEIRIINNVRKLLLHCKREGVEVGLGTSSDREISEALLELLLTDGEVNHYGDGLHADDLIAPQNRVFGDQVQNRKPEKDIFETAALRMGGSYESTLVIDDNLKAGEMAVGATYNVNGSEQRFAGGIALFIEPDRLPDFQASYERYDPELKKRIIFMQNLNYILLPENNPLLNRRKQAAA